MNGNRNTKKYVHLIGVHCEGRYINLQIQHNPEGTLERMALIIVSKHILYYIASINLYSVKEMNIILAIALNSAQSHCNATTVHDWMKFNHSISTHITHNTVQ